MLFLFLCKKKKRILIAPQNWSWANDVTWTVLPMYLLQFLTWEHVSCIAVYGGSERPLKRNRSLQIWKCCHHLLTLMSFQTCMFLSYVVHKLRYSETFWRTQQLLVPINFHSREINTKSMGTINCLITSILQNILYYDQHKKELIQV